MGLLNNEAAEREADKIAFKFKDSNDVIRDMSRAYNTDFSNVKIHTDAAADAKVKSAGRDAIASGNDIFFGRGIYESKDPAANALVAHELAHTMQQGAVLSEGAVSEAAPMGAEQGGLFSRFSNWIKGLSLSKWNEKHKRKRAMKRGESPLSKEETDRYKSELKHSNFTTITEEKVNKLGRKYEESKFVENVGTSEKPQYIPVTPVTPVTPVWMQNDKTKSKPKTAKYSWDYIRKYSMPISYISESPTQEEYDTMGGEFEKIVSASNKQTDMNAALVALALRSKEDKSARAEQALRSHIFDEDYYEGYIKGIDDKGVDYDSILQRSEKWRDTKWGRDISVGSQIGDIALDIMNMIGGSLQTEEGMKYLSFMTKGIEDANVFKNKSDTPLNYMLNTIFTGEGGKFGQRLVRGDYTRNEESVIRGRRQVFIQAMQNTQLLPRINRMSEEERKELPEPLQRLYAEYVELMKKLNALMGTNGTQTTGATNITGE